MSTRDELFAAMSTAIALRQGTVYVSEDGKTPVLHLDWIADYLLAQGWRPPARVITTVEELEALPNNEERATPQEAVEAAAFALDGHSWMTDNEVSLCACGEVLKPSLEYAGYAYRSHLAELALAAALPAIEKEIRAQVAVEMERRADEYLESANQFGGYYLGVKSAFQDAARIAEGADHA